MEKYRGQAFSMIKGQCTLALETKMKADSDYTACMSSNDPLRLKQLIERTIISQSKSKYAWAILYDQLVGLFGFQQNKLSADQWHERFNTKIDIAETLGVSQEHWIGLEQVAQETLGCSYEDIADDDDREKVRDDAKERWLAYIFLRQSSLEHDGMKRELDNAFTMASNDATRSQIYPRT